MYDEIKATRISDKTLAKLIDCPTCGLQVPQATKFCPNDSTLLVPHREINSIPNYTVLQLLGSGGMGDVYEAEHVVLKKRVAIKTLKSNLTDTAAFLRFQTEARATGRLKHPNIVSVYDCGVSSVGEPYMIMDLIIGATLADLLASSEGLKIDESLDIITQICAGVSHAHQNGILHRDLKPSNIILEVNGSIVTARVLDFGIAKILESEQTMNLTRTGELFGTPKYMSPEQANGQKVDQRSDIYALGCIFYEMLTGQPPMLGKTAMEIMLKHMNEIPLPLSQAALKKFPEALEVIVAKSLAKNPADRFSTVEDLSTAITNYRRGIPEKLPSPQTHSPKKKFDPIFLFSVIGASLSVLVAVVIINWCLSTEENKNQSAQETRKNLDDSDKSVASRSASNSISKNKTDGTTPISLNIGTSKQNSNPPALNGNGAIATQQADIANANPSFDADIEFARYARDHHLDENITVSGDNISDQALGAIKNFPNLKVLTLEGCDYINGTGLAALKNCTTLSELKLSGCKKLTPEGIQSLAMLPTVRILKLDSTNVGNDVFAAIKHMHLKLLDLCHTKVNDDGLKSIKPDVFVETLQLKDTNISDRGLAQLTKIVNLLSLNLDRCPRVSDKGVKSLCDLNLKALSLNSTNITPQSADYLVHMSKLERLVLNETKIDDETLAKLATLKNLRILMIKNCNSITDSGVKYFQKHSSCVVIR